VVWCRLDENEQIRTRLEVEALQMADELDIARCVRDMC
jgi:hypothetical protein